MKQRVYYGTNRNVRVRNRKVTFGSESPDDAEDLRFGHISFDTPGATPDTPAKMETHLTNATRGVTIQRYPENATRNQMGSTKTFDRIRARMQKGHSTIVYVHGYSEGFRSSMATVGMLAKYLRPAGTKELTPVLFGWPSDGKKTPWKAYRDDRHDARVSGPALGRALLKLRDHLRGLEGDCNGRLILVCHSMGNYALQNALAHMTRIEGAVLPQLFDEMIMLAPDVDSDALASPAKLGRLSELTDRITLYMHSGDRALWLSDNTKGNPDRLGRSGPHNSATIPDSIDVVDCSDIDTSITQHHYYLETKVYEDMRRVISGATYDVFEGKRKWQPGRNRWRLRP